MFIDRRGGARGMQLQRGVRYPLAISLRLSLSHPNVSLMCAYVYVCVRVYGERGDFLIFYVRYAGCIRCDSSFMYETTWNFGSCAVSRTRRFLRFLVEQSRIYYFSSRPFAHLHRICKNARIRIAYRDGYLRAAATDTDT